MVSEWVSECVRAYVAMCVADRNKVAQTRLLGQTAVAGFRFHLDGLSSTATSMRADPPLVPLTIGQPARDERAVLRAHNFPITPTIEVPLHRSPRVLHSSTAIGAGGGAGSGTGGGYCTPRHAGQCWCLAGGLLVCSILLLPVMLALPQVDTDDDALPQVDTDDEAFALQIDANANANTGVAARTALHHTPLHSTVPLHRPRKLKSSPSVAAFRVATANAVSNATQKNATKLTATLPPTPSPVADVSHCYDLFKDVAWAGPVLNIGTGSTSAMLATCVQQILGCTAVSRTGPNHPWIFFAMNKSTWYETKGASTYVLGGGCRAAQHTPNPSPTHDALLESVIWSNDDEALQTFDGPLRLPRL